MVAKAVTRIWCSFVIVMLLAGYSFAAEVYQVAKIVDGDTFVLTNGQRVRLAYVDTPEMKSDKRKEQYFATDAKMFLTEVVLHKEVVLQKIISQDRYGRVVAIVNYRNNLDLGSFLVQKGAAFVYPHGKRDKFYIAGLLQLQKDAMQSKVGMWKRAITYFKSAGKVIGNRRSKRSFAITCSNAQSIAKRNRVYFDSAVEAFYNGYAPARVCKLWPNTTDILLE